MNMRSLIKKSPIIGPIAHRAYMKVKIARLEANLRRNCQNSPLQIVIGASDVFEPGWIPTEEDFLNLLDTNDWDRYFQPNSVDAILAEHVWEHLKREDGLNGARTCLRYLKSGGRLRVAVPDGYHPDPEYIQWVKVGGSGPGADDHKELYNCETFQELFEEAGFRVQLLEYFDRSGEFHFNDWDPADGMIHRSKRFDRSIVKGNVTYSSLIVDAIKPN